MTLYERKIHFKYRRIGSWWTAAYCAAKNGATVVNKSGITDIYAKITIDATGDGDIAAISVKENVNLAKVKAEDIRKLIGI